MKTKYKIAVSEEEIAKMFDNPRIEVLGIASTEPRRYTIWYKEEKERIVEEAF